MFPAAIGEENEGDTLGLEVGKGFVRARERVGAAGEDTIDAGGRELVWRVREGGLTYSNANAKSGVCWEAEDVWRERRRSLGWLLHVRCA